MDEDRKHDKARVSVGRCGGALGPGEVRLRESIRWLAQTVHQAYHHGPIEDCPKATCRHAVEELRRPDATARCACQREAGYSPCPMHGLEEEGCGS